MMDLHDFGSVEMQILWLSIVLGLAQLLIAVLFSVTGRGLPYGVSARDTPPAPIGTTGMRLERAWHNFIESFPFFLGAVLIAQVTGRHSAMGVFGAQLYFWSRVAYVPTYALGIPYLRTVLWIASLAGIGMVMRGIWPGM
jgi:uncharacterized MAPEG superfamily protein